MLYEALSCFKTLKGHLNVPPKFEVPAETNWPDDLWSMQLGKMVRGRVGGGGDMIAT
ncbi:unnamed protein product [Discosporangium mesarthrocarpum]